MDASTPRLQQVIKGIQREHETIGEMSKGMQAYYHYHHVVNTADIYQGSIAS